MNQYQNQESSLAPSCCEHSVESCNDRWEEKTTFKVKDWIVVRGKELNGCIQRWFGKILEMQVKSYTPKTGNCTHKTKFEKVDTLIINLDKWSMNQLGKIRFKVLWAYSSKDHLPIELPAGYQLGHDEIILSTSNVDFVDIQNVIRLCSVFEMRDYYYNRITAMDISSSDNCGNINVWWRWRFDEESRKLIQYNRDDFIHVCRCRDVVHPHEGPLVQCGLCCGLFHSRCLHTDEILYPFPSHVFQQAEVQECRDTDKAKLLSSDIEKRVNSLYVSGVKSIGSCVVYTKKIVCGHCSGLFAMNGIQVTGIRELNSIQNCKKRVIIFNKSSNDKHSRARLESAGEQRRRCSKRLRIKNAAGGSVTPTLEEEAKDCSDDHVNLPSESNCSDNDTTTIMLSSDRGSIKKMAVEYSVMPPRFTTLGDFCRRNHSMNFVRKTRRFLDGGGLGTRSRVIHTRFAPFDDPRIDIHAMKEKERCSLDCSPLLQENVTLSTNKGSAGIRYVDGIAHRSTTTTGSKTSPFIYSTNSNNNNSLQRVGALFPQMQMYEWETNVFAPLQPVDLGFTYIGTRRLHESWKEFNSKRMQSDSGRTGNYLHSRLNDLLARHERQISPVCTLRLFWTGNEKGWGVRTEQFIPKDSPVLHYTGEVLPIQELIAREANRLSTQSLCVYHSSETIRCNAQSLLLSSPNPNPKPKPKRIKKNAKFSNASNMKFHSTFGSTSKHDWNGKAKKANNLKTSGFIQKTENRTRWTLLNALVEDTHNTCHKADIDCNGTSSIEASASQAVETVNFGVDPLHFGNVARMVNHSCTPCLMTYQVQNDKDLMTHLPPGFYIPPRLVYYSTRDIEAGEELTVDYVHNHNLKDEVSFIAQIPCLCGSDNCRKWVF